MAARAPSGAPRWKRQSATLKVVAGYLGLLEQTEGAHEQG
jgi:hypothetical protein